MRTNLSLFPQPAELPPNPPYYTHNVLFLIFRSFYHARTFFVAALHHAPAQRIAATARLVAACAQNLGSFEDALCYLDMAERHADPEGELRPI